MSTWHAAGGEDPVGSTDTQLAGADRAATKQWGVTEANPGFIGREADEIGRPETPWRVMSPERGGMNRVAGRR